MRGFNLLLIGVCLAGIQDGAYASQFNYNFLSGGYIQQSTSVTGVSKDLKSTGYQLNGSFDITPHLAMTAGVIQESGKMTISGIKVKLNVQAGALGVMYHMPVGAITDVIIGGNLSQARAKATATGSPDSRDTVNGHAVFLSSRTKFGNIIELIAGVTQSYADSDSTTSYNIEVAGHINKDFAVSAGYSTDKDSHATTINLYKFF